MSLRLRPAGEPDLAFILATERLPGSEALVGRWDEATHRARLADPRFAYLVAERDAAALGFAILRDLTRGASRIQLQRIALVAPGQGTGRRVLALIAAHVFADPAVARLDLEVFADNLRARRAYAAAGFVETEFRKQAWRRLDGTVTDEFVMTLERERWQALTPPARPRP